MKSEFLTGLKWSSQTKQYEVMQCYILVLFCKYVLASVINGCPTTSEEGVARFQEPKMVYEEEENLVTKLKLYEE